MTANKKLVTLIISITLTVLAIAYISGTFGNHNATDRVDNNSPSLEEWRSLDYWRKTWDHTGNKEISLKWRSLDYWRKTHSREAILNSTGEGKPFHSIILQG
ncbi:MAG: hypothetical protein ACK4FV_06075 [Candidatus Nitrosocaldus sp.]